MLCIKIKLYICCINNKQIGIMKRYFYYQVIKNENEFMIQARTPAFKMESARKEHKGDFYKSEKMMPVSKILKQEDFNHLEKIN